MIGSIIVVLALATIINTSIFFKEIPQESRKNFQDLKDHESKNNGLREELAKRVEDFTLSGYNECKI